MELKLSVVIVNYNVKYFLEQALLAAQKAAERVPTEIFVVDNNSVDDSVEMVREKFPDVHLIANKDNVGFSKANNQAIRISKGEYVLLLNPDTVVREDTFEKSVAFMDAHPDAGGLGCKMIDGTGNFLPESKRGFPSPAVAFYKAFGLSKLFPNSPKFNKYHLGYLSEDENHEIDVLSGAFMLMRKEALDKVGLLDEAFFMYGEDIDLSYRIVKGGYKNYYFADTTIIHYKGESTKKGSLNYVKTFYNAMIIFTKKHFGGSSQAKLFVAMLNIAIYFRAFLTLISNWAKRFYLPMLDAVLIFLGLFLIKDAWEVIHFNNPDHFENKILYLHFPIYITIWLGSAYFRGAYDRFARVGRLLSGIAVGTLFIAAIYGFFPESYRPSRMLILLGTIGTMGITLGLRGLLHLLGIGDFQWGSTRPFNLVIVGSKEESKRVLNLLYQSHINPNFIGTVAPDESMNDQDFIGAEHQLDEIVHIYKAEEIIFCAQDITAERIIHWMAKLGTDLNYKIVPQHSASIIGSNSKNTAGDLYAIDISFRIASPTNQRNKRLIDVFMAICLFMTFPLHIWFIKEKAGFFRNVFSVLWGSKTWVGYHPEGEDSYNLPTLKRNVLSPVDALKFSPSNPSTIARINLFYAKDWQAISDGQIIWGGFKNLGQTAPASVILKQKSTSAVDTKKKMNEIAKR